MVLHLDKERRTVQAVPRGRRRVCPDVSDSGVGLAVGLAVGGVVGLPVGLAVGSELVALTVGVGGGGGGGAAVEFVPL